MKKMIQWVMAATLICGTSVFTSCTNSANDNPVLPQNSFSVTVKEGGEVTPKVTVSPSEAAEGQTVTLTAAKGYKFRRVEADNAPVTFEENGSLVINKTKLSVPAIWGQEDEAYLEADELPGFKPVTAEEAAKWVATESDKEEGAYLIYGFDKDGNVLYYATLLGLDARAGEPGRLPHNNMSALSNDANSDFRFYYTSSATVIDDKTVATFRMPANNVIADCDMVRDMSVDVTAKMKATEFSLKKEGEGFVLTEGEGMTAIQPEVCDEFGAPLVELQESIDYVLRLQKQDKYSPDKWSDVGILSEGTFRWRILGISTYDGTVISVPFTLVVKSE